MTLQEDAMKRTKAVAFWLGLLADKKLEGQKGPLMRKASAYFGWAAVFTA